MAIRVQASFHRDGRAQILKAKALIGATIFLSFIIVGASAQPMMPPAVATETIAQERAEIAAQRAAISAQRAQIKAEVAEAKAQAKAAAATRQQIQAVKATIRARLAAVHR